MQYTCNAKVVPKSFLKSKTFSPWRISNASEIGELVRILVALTLKTTLVAAEAIYKDETEEQRHKHLHQLRNDDDAW